MTLKEYLETASAPYSKIGASGGQGFIYCGKTSEAIEFLNEFDKPFIKRLKITKEYVLKNIEDLESGGFKKRSEALIEKFKIYLAKKKAKAPDFEKIKKLESFKNVEEYVAYLKKEELILLKKSKTRLERIEKRIENYTPVLDREVKLTYSSLLLNEDGFKDIIVIYLGDEEGRAWDLSEFRNGGALDEK
jgi:hypothetical protein